MRKLPGKSLVWGIVLLALFIIPLSVLAFSWSEPEVMGWDRPFNWDTWPKADVDDQGHVYVVWTTYPSIRYLFFNEYDGENWGSPIRINGRVINCFSADVAIGPEGEPHVSWYGKLSDYGTFYTTRKNGEWSEPKSTGLPIGHTTIAVNPSGIVAIASMNDGIHYAVGNDAGWDYSGKVVGYCYPDLSVDEDGRIYLASCNASSITYRIWEGDTWSDEYIVDTPRRGKVKMFHQSDGSHDIVVISNESMYHTQSEESLWSEPILVTDQSKTPGWMDAAGRNDGVLAAIYVNQQYKEDVMVRIFNGESWLPEENASNTQWRSIWPTIALTSDEKAVAIWSENPDHQFPFVLNASTTILTFNQPPMADAGGPYVVEEGSVIEMFGSGSDPDGDPLNFSWDLNYDGIFETAGQDIIFSAIGRDGPYHQTIALQVCDDKGACDSDTAGIGILNVPPLANAGPDQIVYRFDAVDLTGSWTDPADILDTPYLWTWDLDGDGVVDSSGSSSYGDLISENVSFELEGIYTLVFSVMDKDGGTSTDTVEIEVLNRPPVCNKAFPSKDNIWPVNHKFVPIEIQNASDPEGDPYTLTILSIFQDEPLDELGDGDTEADGRGLGESIAEVRAERSGVGNGRFYHITFSVDDGHGGVCTDEVLVGVPFDSRPEGAPLDEGPLYDSTVPMSE